MYYMKLFEIVQLLEYEIILEAGILTKHIVERLIGRMGLDETSARKVGDDLTKRFVEWNRRFMHPLPQLYHNLLPQTSWFRLDLSPYGHKTWGIVVLNLTFDHGPPFYQTATILDPTMTDSAGSPLAPGGGPLTGLPLKHLEKYMDYLMTKTPGQKVSWRLFKDGRR